MRVNESDDLFRFACHSKRVKAEIKKIRTKCDSGEEKGTL